MDQVEHHSLLKAMDRVRAARASGRADAPREGEATAPVKAVSGLRARLNELPDEGTLTGRINQALVALSRGVRWARGSILNLLV